MLSKDVKDRLKRNWGPKAESMECNAEVRLYDPFSPWECFVYAMNPENENEILCVMKGFSVAVESWTITEMMECFNEEGDLPSIDKEFRPRNVATIYKKLTEGNYVSRRD